MKRTSEGLVDLTADGKARIATSSADDDSDATDLYIGGTALHLTYVPGFLLLGRSRDMADEAQFHPRRVPTAFRHQASTLLSDVECHAQPFAAAQVIAA